MTYALGKTLFLHLPKTGGHCVWKIFEAHGGYRLKDKLGDKYNIHHSARGLKQRFGRSYDYYEKISLVRNPWERAVSLYFGRNKLNKFSPAGFEKYMRQWRSLRKYRWNPNYPQSRFTLPGVLIFDLAKIDLLYEWIEKRHQIKIINPGIIKTGKNRYQDRLHYREYYTSKLRADIAQAHKTDIKKYGWKF